MVAISRYTKEGYINYGIDMQYLTKKLRDNKLQNLRTRYMAKVENPGTER